MGVSKIQSGSGVRREAMSLMPVRLAPSWSRALLGRQLYGWTGTCLGGRPGTEIWNFGSRRCGFWENRSAAPLRACPCRSTWPITVRRGRSWARRNQRNDLGDRLTDCRKTCSVPTTSLTLCHALAHARPSTRGMNFTVSSPGDPHRDSCPTLGETNPPRNNSAGRDAGMIEANFIG